MKCEVCKTNVDDKFEYAIKSNQCPACGKNIMSPERLAVLVSLKSLLNGVLNTDAEKVANLIIANFDLKQKFKELPVGENIRPSEAPMPKAEVGSIENIEVSEDDGVNKEDIEFDETFKQRQMAEARKKIREEAYDSALRSQYGMEDSDSDFFTDENEDPVARADRLKQEYKRSTSKDKMLTGGGSFSRSE